MRVRRRVGFAHYNGHLELPQTGSVDGERFRCVGGVVGFHLATSRTLMRTVFVAPDYRADWHPSG
jgi:hypothetical protein